MMKNTTDTQTKKPTEAEQSLQQSTSEEKNLKPKTGATSVKKVPIFNLPIEEAIAVNTRPPEYVKMGRRLIKAIPQLEKTMWLKIKDKDPRPMSKRELKNYLNAFVWAIGQKLSDDSYIVGNGQGTGKWIIKNSKGKPIEELFLEGESVPVKISLPDILDRAGWENPNQKQRKDMKKLIQEIIPIVPIMIKSNNGKAITYTLASIKGSIDDEFFFIIHPIFYMYYKGYAKHPHDIMKKLVQEAGTGMTGVDRILTAYLGSREKRNHYKIPITDLVKDIGIEDEYKHDKTGVVSQLTQCFNRQVNIGTINKAKLLAEEDAFDIDPNPDYGKEQKKQLSK